MTPGTVSQDHMVYTVQYSVQYSYLCQVSPLVYTPVQSPQAGLGSRSPGSVGSGQSLVTQVRHQM